MITCQGYPQDGGLYTGYEVIRDEQKIGSIEIGGFFRKNAGMTLTEDEQDLVRAWCKRVYEQPSEHGCLGVGEPPTEPFNEGLCGDVSRNLAVR